MAQDTDLPEIPVTWKGKPAVQLRGWQANQHGNPNLHTTVIRVAGRRRVAYAKDIKTVE
jgi:hypothetical protein